MFQSVSIFLPFARAHTHISVSLSKRFAAECVSAKRILWNEFYSIVFTWLRMRPRISTMHQVLLMHSNKIETWFFRSFRMQATVWCCVYTAKIEDNRMEWKKKCKQNYKTVVFSYSNAVNFGEKKERNKNRNEISITLHEHNLQSVQLANHKSARR